MRKREKLRQPQPKLDTSIDFSKRCALLLMPLREGVGKEFEVIVYGRTAAGLQTIPNDVVGALAERYPDFASSIFFVRELENYDMGTDRSLGALDGGDC